MTKARIPAGSGEGSGTGAEKYNSSTQYPEARTFDEVPGRLNRMDAVDEFQFILTGSSTGEVTSVVAKDNGRVTGITVKNGATAADGSNGWKIVINDESQADDILGSFGVGTGTNAAAATDNKAVAANATAYLSSALGLLGANRFSKGDIITVDVTEDGTAGALDVIVHLEYGSLGNV